VALATTEGKVLIVEDEVIYAFDVQRFLTDRHIAASVCHTGEEALRVMSHDPDIALVLMDLDLGDGVDGMETAGRILKDHDVPLLFLSVHTEWELVEPLLGIDHYGFLPKSAGEFAILQGVNSALKLARSRRELLASEERYRGLVESLSDSVLVIDGDYTVQSANGAALSLLGGVKCPIGEKCYRCCHGFESPCPWCPACEALISGHHARRMVPFAPEEGESKWFNIEASPVRNPDGGVVGVVLSGRDVSQEEEARRCYEKLFHSAPVGVFRSTLDGRFVEANPAFVSLLGYSSADDLASEVKELGWTLFLDSEDLTTIAALLEKGPGTEPADVRVRRKDGKHRVVRLHVHRVVDSPGEDDAIEGFCEDITEKQAMQKEVGEREQLLRTFVNESLDAIVITDVAGNITSWNPAAEKQFRATPGEALGTPVWDTVLRGAVPPEEDESRIRTLRDQMKLLLATGDAPLAGSIIETDYVYSDATHRTTHQRFFAIQGGNGCQLGLVSRDVTDLVMAERALADRHRRVTDLLQERDLLLKEVHHRIKNDMLLVRSLLSLQAGRTSSEEAAGELSDAANRITLMSRIYERLYRSDNYESIRIRPTVLSIVSDLLSGAGRGGISLETDIEDRELSRKISIPVGIIINELVSNALKYAYDANPDPRLRVGLEVNDGMVEIEVEDNGPGMPDKFRRAEGSVEIEAVDSFGYTMIRALVTQHLGTISVADGRTRGTVVRVTLALPEAEHAEPSTGS
jgi:PAS domain S-box-containing protein